MRPMLLVLPFAAALLAVATIAQASERVIVDDLGRKVLLPAAVTRVVSLDDVSVTVPLLELGVIPIGSEGRIDKQGELFVRSSRTMTGLDFSNTDMAFLGRNPVDVETLVNLKPDLIVTLRSRTTPIGQLEAIAPTVVIDDEKRSSAEIYQLLAEVSGTEERLAVLQSRYQAQIEQLKRIKAIYGPVTISVLSATEDGKIGVEHTYGSLGVVLRDAGFRLPELVEQMTPNTDVNFGPEALPDLDADIIFDTFRNDKNETAADAKARMKKLLPDYCQFLEACRNRRYFIVPRDEAKSITYVALTMAVAMVTTAVSTLDTPSE